MLHSIQEILSKNKNIGIFLSGGFDSAVLSYLMHKYNVDSTFQFFTIARYDNSFIHAKNIIQYLDFEFNLENRRHHKVGNPTLRHDQQVLSGIKQALELNFCDIYVIADTTNPSELLNGPARIKANNPKIAQPFFDLTKDSIVQIAIDHKLDKIMELSHTCTETNDLRCNECWQCKERAWAFSKCNFVDPGTM